MTIHSGTLSAWSLLKLSFGTCASSPPFCASASFRFFWWSFISSTASWAFSAASVRSDRFRPSVVKDCIHAVLKEELANAEYSPEEMPQLTKHLSENIKDKLKEMGFDRYKMVVQVVIGEQRGEGVFMAARCFWDADTDNCTHDVFMNDSLFCVVAAFGCFYY